MNSIKLLVLVGTLTLLVCYTSAYGFDDYGYSGQGGRGGSFGGAGEPGLPGKRLRRGGGGGGGGGDGGGGGGGGGGEGGGGGGGGGGETVSANVGPGPVQLLPPHGIVPPLVGGVPPQGPHTPFHTLD